MNTVFRRVASGVDAIHVARHEVVSRMSGPVRDVFGRVYYAVRRPAREHNLFDLVDSGSAFLYIDHMVAASWS